MKRELKISFAFTLLSIASLILDEDYNLAREDKNIVIAGHKENISDVSSAIEVGGEIQLETNRGTYNYEIEEARIVNQEDTEVLGNNTNEEQLLIYTCYPFEWWSRNNERYIIINKNI